MFWRETKITSSWREVRVIEGSTVNEGKITVNLRKKSRGNRLWFDLARARFELARVRVIGSQLYIITYTFSAFVLLLFIASKCQNILPYLNLLQVRESFLFLSYCLGDQHLRKSIIWFFLNHAFIRAKLVMKVWGVRDQMLQFLLVLWSIILLKAKV